MPVSNNKASHGKRYTESQKERILRFVLENGLTPKTLENMVSLFGAENVPNTSTINRWFYAAQKKKLEQLKPRNAFENDRLRKLTEKRIKRGKSNTENTYSLSMKSFYLCFYHAYNMMNGHLDVDDPNSFKSFCGFLKYILDNYKSDLKDEKERTKAFYLLERRLATNSPYSAVTQEIFGNNRIMYRSVVEKMKLLTLTDSQSEANQTKENKLYQKYLAKELATLISDSNTLSADTKKSLNLSLTVYAETSQGISLAAAAIGLLNCIVWGEDNYINDIRLDKDIIQLIRSMGIPDTSVSELLRVALTEGIQGRMGRRHFEFLQSRVGEINPLAAYELGEYYFNNGQYDEAYEHFLKAASFNHPVGLWSCGYMLVRGLGKASQSYATDAERYKAAQQFFITGDSLGSQACTHALGQLYMREQFVDENMKFIVDYDKAIQYLKKACNTPDGNHTSTDVIEKYGYGFINSHIALAWVYEQQKDYIKAFLHYKKAAKYGDGYSRNRLGFYLEQEWMANPKPKEKAACYYLYALDVIDAYINDWSYYNAARVFCGELFKGDLHDNELNIHVSLPDENKARFYLEKSCTFFENMCRTKEPKEYMNAQGSFLKEYEHCMSLMTSLAHTDSAFNESVLIPRLQKAQSNILACMTFHKSQSNTNMNDNLKVLLHKIERYIVKSTSSQSLSLNKSTDHC